MGARNNRKHLLGRESCPRRLFSFTIDRHLKVPRYTRKVGEEKRDCRG